MVLNRAGRIWPGALSLAAVMIAVSACGQAQLTCSAEFPAFDAAGNPVPVRIDGVFPTEGPEVNLLHVPIGPMRFRASGHTLFFGERLLQQSKPLRIVLKDQAGKKHSRTAVLLGCHSRVSTTIRYEDRGFDTSHNTIKGTLRGCVTGPSWWIIAAPMFPGQEGRVAEGHIQGNAFEEPADNGGRRDRSSPVVGPRRPLSAFEIRGPLRGERHVVVIGKGRDIVKSVTAAIHEGGPDNDLGVIDLSGHCPAKP